VLLALRIGSFGRGLGGDGCGGVTQAGWIRGGVIARYSRSTVKRSGSAGDAVGSKLDERGRRLFAAGKIGIDRTFS